MLKATRIVLLFALCTLLLTSLSWAGPSPMEQVKETIDKVIEIIKSQDLNRDAKREKLSATIRSSFDFTSMSQRILAQNWRKTSPQEREQFIRLLAELLERSYIGNIENYTDEKVEFVKERIKQKNAAIDTLIITESKEIPVSYRMLQNKEEWKVYDVVIESVSFVNNYRNSYGQVIKKQGMAGLLAKMEEKLTQLRQES